MSLIGGLLAGAAQGVSDSWTNRRAELKEEAANAFKQAAIKLQAEQFKERNIFEAGENEKNRDLKFNENLAGMNAAVYKNYYALKNKADMALAKNELTKGGYDKLMRGYTGQLTAANLTVPSEGKRDPLDELGENGLKKPTAAELEVKRVEELEAKKNLDEYNSMLTRSPFERSTDGLLNAASVVGETLKIPFVAASKSGKTMERNSLVKQWDNGMVSDQHANAIIEQHAIDPKSVSTDDLKKAKRVVELASKI